MKKKIALIVILLFVVVIACGCFNKTADTVVYGTIYTAEEGENEVVEAFAVKDGKYIYVGDKKGAQKYIKEGKTEVIDKTGEGLIIPGCTEGHSHYFDGSGLNTQLPGSSCSYDEVLKILKERVEKEGISQFVSFGWKGSDINDKRNSGFSFAEELESIAPGIPVVLIENTGHSALCNTTALKQAGILEKPEVRGGAIELDSNGKPSGYVGDQAVFFVTDKVIKKPLTEEQYDKACEFAVNKLLELGYTNALDAFTNMYNPTGLYEAIKRMDDAGKLKVNVAGCYNIKSYDSAIYKKRVDEVSDIVKNYSSTHFNPGYIKLFLDGIVENGTGWMLEEYSFAEEGKEHGNIIWNQDELNAITKYANSKDIIIHAHTYGDAACKTMLNSYIASNKANGGEFRNCIAHVRNIQEEDKVRAAENGIPVAANIIWHTGYKDDKPSEKAVKDFMISNIGEAKFYGGYPMKSLVDKGVVVSSSTDAPAAQTVEGSIMNVLQVATTGVDPSDDAEPFAPEELLTVKEGLKALTINGAWQLGLEKERGSILKGKYADFIILDKNILDYKGEQLNTIGKTRILNTYFEGEKVYTAK